MSKIQNKLANCQYNYSKNFFKALIAPVVAVILAIVFAFTFGFNKDMDYTGGIMVSVVAGTEANLYESETYNEFKSRVDDVLADNDVFGKVYTIELNDKQEYTLVAKIAYAGSEDARETLIANLKSDLIAEFYATTPSQDIENNGYIIVDNFGSSVDNSIVLITALACLIGTILMCVYIALRMGLNASILTFVNVLANNVLTLALIMVLRVPLTYASIAVVPFVTIMSVISAFIYFRKNKELLTSTEKYQKESNYTLANDAVKQTSFLQLMLGGVAIIALLAVGLFNVLNSVLFTSLAFVVSVISLLYTNIMLLPGLFARTYIRKVKKQKIKQEKKEEKRLTEEEVMQETDLDNIVSN